jgi:hypothetical protein
MKIEFADHSYIQISKDHNSNKIFITIVAKDNEKPLVTIAQSVELTVEQFNNLININQ